MGNVHGCREGARYPYKYKIIRFQNFICCDTSRFVVIIDPDTVCLQIATYLYLVHDKYSCHLNNFEIKYGSSVEVPQVDQVYFLPPNFFTLEPSVLYNNINIKWEIYIYM